jgi:hypothetical protein
VIRAQDGLMRPRVEWSTRPAEFRDDGCAFSHRAAAHVLTARAYDVRPRGKQRTTSRRPNPAHAMPGRTAEARAVKT